MDFILKILSMEKPSSYIRNNSEEIFNVIPELALSKDFNQNNNWHVYDVFEHILHVVDGVSNNHILRIAALFHDIGKPFVYKEDENKVGHFWGHWDKSYEIFLKYKDKFNISEEDKKLISNLILYHDLNVGKLAEEELNNLLNIFDKDGIIMLYELKQSDLLAQNKEFHYLLNEYELEKQKVLSKF